MEVLIQILKDHGLAGGVFAFIIYFLLKSDIRINFRGGNRRKSDED